MIENYFPGEDKGDMAMDDALPSKETNPAHDKRITVSLGDVC